MIDVVAFDYGNVLAHQVPALRRQLIELTGIPDPEFTRRYDVSRDAYDQGTLDGRAYWTEFLGRDTSPELIDRLIRIDVESGLTLDTALVRWAGQLREAGHRLAILSNMPQDIVNGLRRAHAGLLQQFDVTLFSCQLGVIKPAAGIYERLLADLATPPGQVLFVDDKQKNVDAAWQLGMAAVRFDTIEQLASLLQIDKNR